MSTDYKYLVDYNRVASAIESSRDTELSENHLRTLKIQLDLFSDMYSNFVKDGKLVRKQNEYPYIFYYPLSHVLIYVGSNTDYPKVRIGPCTNEFEFNTTEEDTHFGIKFSTETEAMGYALPLKKRGKVISGWIEK